MTAVAIIHRDRIIQELAKGQRLSDIAPSLGVSTNALSKVLKTDPEYRNAIEAGFHVRLDIAERSIEEAVDQVDVARARTRFQSVAWRAEREFPATWGAKQQVTVNQGVTVDEALDGMASALLDRMRVVPQQLQCNTDQDEGTNEESEQDQ